MTQLSARTIFFCRPLAVFLLLGCVSLADSSAPNPPVGDSGVVERVMHYNGIDYPFSVYVPTTYNSKTPLPSLLMVHGAGGNGPEFLQNWRAFAEAKGIILVAPTLDLSAAAETQVPVVFPRLMETVQSEWSLDHSRRYLFGYSAGGYFVYDAALLNSDYFAAAAVYASVIQPEYDGIVQQATRKTGIAIYLGDEDPFFSPQQGRRTRDLLVASGIDVRYVEMPNASHDYEAVASVVNADAWQFLTTHVLR